MQIGLAVGDTQEVKKKAEFTKFQVRVSNMLLTATMIQ